MHDPANITSSIFRGDLLCYSGASEKREAEEVQQDEEKGKMGGQEQGRV